MTRRNTYVCSERSAPERSTTDQGSVPLQNGQDGRYTHVFQEALQSGPCPLTPPPAVCPPSSVGTPPQRSVGGASTHSVSSAAASSERFPRGTASRSTFHGGQLRERRTATYNGPPASPSLSHDPAALSQSRARGSTNLFSKLTSRLTRRYVELLLQCDPPPRAPTS